MAATGRPEFIGLKVSEAERRIVELAANRRGCSMSEVVRDGAVSRALELLDLRSPAPADRA